MASMVFAGPVPLDRATEDYGFCLHNETTYKDYLHLSSCSSLWHMGASAVLCMRLIFPS
jgi:hypothetical protein